MISAAVNKSRLTSCTCRSIRFDSSRGATIVEFTLVSLLFILFLVAMLDFSRYFAVRSILTKGAQMGLTIAKRDRGFTIDIANIDTTQDGGALYSKKVQEFTTSREKIVREALELPLATFAGDTSNLNGRMPLKTYSTYYLAPLGKSDFTQTSTVLLLRPGESAKSGEQWVDHPQLCYSGSPTCQSERSRGQVLASVMKDFPIVLELHAEVEMILPGLPNISVVGRAVGFQEQPLGVINERAPWTPGSPTSTIVSTTTTNTTTTTTGGPTTTGGTTTTTTLGTPCGDPSVIQECRAKGMCTQANCNGCRVCGGAR